MRYVLVTVDDGGQQVARGQVGQARDGHVEELLGGPGDIERGADPRARLIHQREPSLVAGALGDIQDPAGHPGGRTVRSGDPEQGAAPEPLPAGLAAAVTAHLELEHGLTSGQYPPQRPLDQAGVYAGQHLAQPSPGPSPSRRAAVKAGASWEQFGAARGTRAEPPTRAGPGPKTRKRYLLVACTSLLTYYFLGDRSMATFTAFVLPDMGGTVLVHDRYQNYDAIPGLLHQLCTQHILRDLDDAAQTYPHAHWPAAITLALQGLIHAPNTAPAQRLPP